MAHIPPEGEFLPADSTDGHKNHSFVTDDDLQALMVEAETFNINDPRELADKMLQENLVMAIQSIANIARHGTNERTRLDASKYITERVLGKVTDGAKIGDTPRWESLIASAVED